jgi:hypothetical protein
MRGQVFEISILRKRIVPLADFGGKGERKENRVEPH